MSFMRCACALAGELIAIMAERMSVTPARPRIALTSGAGELMSSPVVTPAATSSSCVCGPARWMWQSMKPGTR